MATSTVEDNKVIAKFHGWKHVPTPKGKGKGQWHFPEWGKAGFTEDSFLYHSSWDWLMAVVHKILHSYNPIKGGWPYEYLTLSNTVIGNMFGHVYIKVVEFIKWHNKQPQ